MTPYIDTHTHLYMSDVFSDGGDAALERARQAGVGMMVLPAVSMATAESLFSLHARHPECTSVAPGLHPTEVRPGEWKSEVDDILAMFADCGPVAVGEIGMDLYWDRQYVTAQMDAFGYQLDRAASAGLPVIVHCRSALKETLEVARIMGASCPRLLFHSFTTNAEEASEILSVCEDALFVFNGVVTFKNAASVREAAAFVGLDRIVSETDSPYLSPTPFRGQTNESSRIPLIVEAIASATSSDIASAAEAIYRNASGFFGWNNT